MFGPATAIEKLDAALFLATYPILVIVLVNVVVSTYVCHRAWVEDKTILEPHLAYLCVAMFFASMAVLGTASERTSASVRYFLCAFATYAAAAPIAAYAFFYGLWGTRRFDALRKVLISHRGCSSAAPLRR